MSNHSIEIESYVIDQIRCPECALTCLQKNIYRHMITMHNWTTDDCKVLLAAIRNEKKSRESKTSFVCSYCRVLFRSVRHLVQHKRICASQPPLLNSEDPDSLEPIYMDEMIVEGEEEVVVAEEYQLEEVDESEPIKQEKQEEQHEKPSTSYESMVPPHRQTVRPIPPHHINDKTRRPYVDRTAKFPVAKYVVRHRGSHLKCPECLTPAESLEDLMNHCSEKHETPERKFFCERKMFQTREEFKKWFDQRQEDTCTSLTKRTGHGGETLYRCHRVGKYDSVAKSRKSNPRKIDQTCTAYLKVSTDDDGTTWVHGCFTHIGHELDHKLLWLTKTQENYVRELIDLGWTSDQIFFYIRNEYKDYECKLKYVSKNDIRNITVRYNREKEKLGFLTEHVSTDSRLIPVRHHHGIRDTSVPLLGNSSLIEDDEDDVKGKVPRLYDNNEEEEEEKDVEKKDKEEKRLKKVERKNEDAQKPLNCSSNNGLIHQESTEGDEIINVVDVDTPTPVVQEV